MRAIVGHRPGQDGPAVPGTEFSNWRTQTKAMLVARATAEVSRWIASDAMLGLPLLAEEIEDGQEANGQVPAIANVATGPEGPPPGKELAAPPAEGAKTATRRRTAPKRAALPAAAPAGDRRPRRHPSRRCPSSHRHPSPRSRSHPRRRCRRRPAPASWPACGPMHITGREESLALISAWVGRTVESDDDLLDDEAHVVIERTDALLSLGAAKVDQADEETPEPPPEDDQPDPPPPDDQLEAP